MYAILDGIEGHKVAGFDGESTLDDLVHSRPQLLLVDLRIAGADMKGWDLLLLSRADPSLRDVPLIVCSADTQTMSARAAEFKRLGIYTLLRPFSIDEVKSVVELAPTAVKA